MLEVCFVKRGDYLKKILPRLDNDAEKLSDIINCGWFSGLPTDNFEIQCDEKQYALIEIDACPVKKNHSTSTKTKKAILRHEIKININSSHFVSRLNTIKIIYDTHMHRWTQLFRRFFVEMTSGIPLPNMPLMLRIIFRHRLWRTLIIRLEARWQLNTWTILFILDEHKQLIANIVNSSRIVFSSFFFFIAKR